jgi:hypothetical protein
VTIDFSFHRKNPTGSIRAFRYGEEIGLARLFAKDLVIRCQRPVVFPALAIVSHVSMVGGAWSTDKQKLKTLVQMAAGAIYPRRLAPRSRPVPPKGPAPASGLICLRAALSHFFPHSAICITALLEPCIKRDTFGPASRCHLLRTLATLCGFSAVSFWSFSRRSSTIAWSRAATNDGRSFWGAGSNCAKLYFSVLYATLTGQFGFGLGEAGSRCARSFPGG